MTLFSPAPAFGVGVDAGGGGAGDIPGKLPKQGEAAGPPVPERNCADLSGCLAFG
jgi:hypothetical protein